jgi:hypothetical protein
MMHCLTLLLPLAVKGIFDWRCVDSSTFCDPLLGDEKDHFPSIPPSMLCDG